MLYLVKRGRPCRSTAKGKTQIRDGILGLPAINTEASQRGYRHNPIQKSRTELAKLKPVKVTLGGDQSLTEKRGCFRPGPTLEQDEKMQLRFPGDCRKKYGKDIEVKAPTLAKYLSSEVGLKSHVDKKKLETDTTPYFHDTAQVITAEG